MLNLGGGTHAVPTINFMNIIIFGPNGSGKGTQGAILKKKFNLPHIETGVLFREHKKNNTPLGKEITQYMDRGELVPDELTIRVLWERLSQADCKKGWLLDGFPRNPSQAENLLNSLNSRNIQLGYIIEIKLDRATAKARLIGRRLCANDPNHPNNLNIPEIRPIEKNKIFLCRVCQGALSARADDIDEKAIDKRHDIYYDTKNGTLASIAWMKSKLKSTSCKVLDLDGSPSVEKVTQQLEKALK